MGQLLIQLSLFMKTMLLIREVTLTTPLNPNNDYFEKFACGMHVVYSIKLIPFNLLCILNRTISSVYPKHG